MGQKVIDVLSQPMVGTILGLIGLAAAIYFYFKSQRTPRLAYQTAEFNVVGAGDSPFPNDLEIRFADIVVPQVTSTTIVLWNAGTETFLANQLVADDALRVEVSEDQKILQAEITKQTRAVNNINLVHNQQITNLIKIDFDYVDPSDGATIEVLHTGSKGDLRVHGTIRGLPDGISNYGFGSWRIREGTFATTKIKFRRIVVAGMIVGILLSIGGLVAWRVQDETDPNGWLPPFVLTITGTIYFITAGLALWAMRMRYPALLDPRR